MPIPASQRQHSSLQAGNFMGLMGQVLQQMTATMPQGAALTVEGIKYHPAGKLTTFNPHPQSLQTC